MNQKERLEEIKKTHEKEQYERKLLIHRVIFAAAVILIILLIIFGVKWCMSAVSEKAEQRMQAELAAQATPEPTPIPIVNSTEISDAYFSNSAFVGNSFIEGLFICDLIDGADFFSKIGLNVNDAMTKSTDTGTVPVIDELNSGKEYDKIFMMFGENELGWVNSDTFISQYGDLIDKAREYQPESKIYLLALPPVSKALSDKNVNSITNERILIYNGLIKQLAADKGAVFADIYSAVADSEGVLPADAASDGIHFGEEYYKQCLLYIQNNLQ